MNGKYFLDTNILIYALESAETRKQQTALTLLRHGLTSQQGVVSHQVVQEFFSVAFRKFATLMKPADAERYFESVFRPMLAVQSSAALFVDALRSYREHNLSWYDALIVAAALQAKCTLLYSEDFQDGRRFGSLEVRNPFLGE